MNVILKKACENFAKSLGLEEVKECNDENIKGYVSKISINGDLNYDIFLILPKEKLDMISEIFFESKEYDLEDLTKEITNLIVGNSKVVAGENKIDFDISTPEFLGEFKNNINYDNKLCFETNGVKFYILYKEK